MKIKLFLPVSVLSAALLFSSFVVVHEGATFQSSKKSTVVLPDQDQDGVPDLWDRCPDTPFGVRVGPDGCPEIEPPQFFDNDQDQDGVEDIWDRCPDTPRGVEVGPDGCPLF